jgi:Flp pilus assembly protein TadG
MYKIFILKNQKGASAVEFAIILPVLVMLIFAIFEFGIAFNNYIALTHAAREGARLAAVGCFEDPDCDFEQAVKDSAPTVNIETINVENPEGNMIGKPVVVTVTGEVFIIEIPMAGEYGPIQLTSKATMRREQ